MRVRGTFETIIIPFILLFEGIGLAFFISGARKIIKKRRTNLYGVSTYGIVVRILETGARTNDRDELEAEILTYLEHEKCTKIFKKIIGFKPAKYKPGEYLMLKQFENNINIVQKVDESAVPNYILEALDANIDEVYPKTMYIGEVKYIRYDLVISANIDDTL